jgi:hypothetical protein
LFLRLELKYFLLKRSSFVEEIIYCFLRHVLKTDHLKLGQL